MRRASEYIITSIEEKFLTLLHDLVGPRAMLKRLYEAASPTPGFMAREITPKYNEALKGPRDLRALPQWLDRWETVIMKAFRYRLPATFNGQWLREMGKAIEPLTSFHGQALMQAACRLDEVAAQITIQGASYLLPEGSITVIRPGDAPAAPSNAISLLDDASIYTYRKALNNVRDWVQTHRLKMMSRSVRGRAFPTPEGTAETSDDGEGREISRLKRPRAETQSTRGPRKATTRCETCGKIGHKLPQCWHLLEDQRPNNMPASEAIAKKV